MDDSQKRILTLVSVNEVPDATVINKSALRSMGNQTVNVDINARVIPDMDRSLISIVATCSFIAEVGYMRTRILVSSVVATFKVEELSKHIVKEGKEIVVEKPLMLGMLEITVGALRGVVAVRTQGTKLRNTPLPILNLEALMYRINYGRISDGGNLRIE